MIGKPYKLFLLNSFMMNKMYKIYRIYESILHIPLGIGEKLLIYKIKKENKGISEQNLFTNTCGLFKKMGYRNKKFDALEKETIIHEKEILNLWMNNQKSL